MIDYWPVIVKSTQSMSSIWFEISNRLDGDKSCVRLHVSIDDGRYDPAKLSSPFFKGTEEGFTETVFDIKVTFAAIENMVREMQAQMEDSSNFEKLEITLAPDQQSFCAMRIMPIADSTDLAFQFVYHLNAVAVHSSFQIHTARENLLKLAVEMGKKLEFLQSKS